jgi:putative nucleotidyltransferase with HDIG domain
MNRLNNNNRFGRLIGSYLQLHLNSIILLGSTLLLLGIASYFSTIEVNGLRQLTLSDFEVGRVADRDVVASRELSYVDEDATRIRIEARKKLVPAIFRYDTAISISMLEQFTACSDFLEELYRKEPVKQQFILEFQQEYPGLFDQESLARLHALKDRSTVIKTARNVFRQLVSEGIADFPDEGMEEFNAGEIEIIYTRNGRDESSIVSRNTVILRDALESRVEDTMNYMPSRNVSVSSVMLILDPFIRENILFQRDESERKMEAELRQVQPVMVTLQKGQRIIKRGFIVTEESYRQLEALAKSGARLNTRKFFTTMVWLLVTVLLSLFLFSGKVLGNRLDFRMTTVVAVCFFVLYLVTLLARKTATLSLSVDTAVLIPAALVSMLVTILVNKRTAVLNALVCAVGIYIAADFTPAAALFALISGFAGAAVVRISGKRIDLVKSACFLAIIQPVLMAAMLMIHPMTNLEPSTLLLGASANGFLSGILVLGFLPILETLLNTSTSFRLMEFSDLNSPIMKKMLLSASGTYNHSIMVATLAESACREIGADPLLARVGAYYHDIGKMDQSEYFVENQSGHNRHVDINPRLSATVIRSHVKQGVEKARQLRLPREVIDIISEHHGNSLISYFYNEAAKTSPDVDPEDFTYPGIPPKTRESAVVMLADVVEAACRTLDKPSVPRLEKFIDELVDHKIETKQLDACELTFREIGIIKKTFLKILAGYYHSRIEYPNQKDTTDTPAGESGEPARIQEKTPSKEKVSRRTTGKHAKNAE